MESTPAADRRPTGVRYMIFVLACATSWLFYLHRYSWGVLKPTIKTEYGLDNTELGWLDSAFYISYGLGQLPGGMVADRFGTRLTLSASVLLWSIVLGATGALSGFWPLAGLRTLFGLTQAAAYPALNKVTRSWFPLSIRTVVQGIVGTTSGRSGGACASLIVATLLMGICGLGWRSTLFLLALAGVVLAIALAWMFRNGPREHPWTNEAEQQLIETGETSPAPGKSFVFRWDRANRWNMGACLVTTFASAFADNLFVMWIFLFLDEAKGLSKEAMGAYGSLPLWGGALGGVCAGYLNDWLIGRTGNRRLGRSTIGLTGKMLAGVLIAGSLLVEDGRAVMIVLFFCKFFSDWSQPTMWGTVTDIGGPASGRVFGLVNTSANVGAFVAGPVMGSLTKNYGWDGLFGVVAVSYVISSLSWLAIDCTRKLVVEEDRTSLAD